MYRFFSGEATVEQEEQVLDWFDESPANKHELLAERRLFDAMLMHAQPAVKSRKSGFTLPRWTREVVKYAAVVLLAVGLGAGYVVQRYNKYLLAGNTISVPAGQRVDLVLPDGTKVCMNALSELRYPGFFIGKNRKVQLKGEAFFEVAHDSDRPFIVETFACDVEVLGTKFDVEAHPERAEFIASLVEGKVRVTDRQNPDNRIEMQPNEQVRHVNGRLVKGLIPEYEGFIWREGLIGFRDASFMELIRQFEKYYGIRIEMQRKDVSRNLFTGKIRISEGIDHALWVLQQSADFRYSRNDTRDVIYIQ